MSDDRYEEVARIAYEAFLKAAPAGTFVPVDKNAWIAAVKAAHNRILETELT